MYYIITYCLRLSSKEEDGDDLSFSGEYLYCPGLTFVLRILTRWTLSGLLGGLYFFHGGELQNYMVKSQVWI